MERVKVDKLPESVHFQTFAWNPVDSVVKDDLIDGKIVTEYEYIIYACGVDIEGRSVCAKITNFNPYMFVDIPSEFSNRDSERLYKAIKSNMYNESYGLVGYEIVHKEKIKPYLAGRIFKMMKLSFKTDKAFKKCKYMFMNQYKTPIRVDGVKHRIYQASDTIIDHLTRFFHVSGITSSGWIKIDKFTEDLNNTGACINIVAHCDDIIADPDKNTIASKVLFGIDIEALPENTEEFPNPELPNDIICQIGVTLVKFGQKEFHKYIFTHRPCADIAGVTVIVGNGEKELLENYCKFYKKIDPDIIIAHNSWGFDDKYIWIRCRHHSIDVSCFSRITELKPSLITRELSSSAYGNNEFSYISYQGRETLDTLAAIRREIKLENYSLNAVSEEFLGEIRYYTNKYTAIPTQGELSDEHLKVLEIIKTSDEAISCKCIRAEGIRRVYWPSEPTEKYIETLCMQMYRKKIVDRKKVSDKKKDLEIRQMFKKLNGPPTDVAECAAYCVHDSYLPIAIVLKRNMIPNYIEMAKTTYVPIEWLLFRGQQCKVFSLLVRKGRLRNCVVPTNDNEVGKPYKGATVLTANIGIYYEPVAALDFASLYPSIMIAYNMCYSTYISDEDTMRYVIENGIPYKLIEWDETDEDTGVTVHHSNAFVQYKDEDGTVLEKGFIGILPEILLELWEGRKATKKLMKKETDPFMYAVLNGKQLSQKVVMNSIYGFAGADKGMLPCKPIAASVTACGRNIIKTTASIVTEVFGAYVVYGDSIPGYEIVTMNKDGAVHECSVEEFSESMTDIMWQEYRGFKINDLEIKNKEYKDLSNSGLTTWTHEGYMPVNKVIRHTTTKKLYKITAMDSSGNLHTVTVTEGHSLIGSDGQTIEAQSLKLGDKLYEYF